jgi:hypothetical protein
LLETLGPEEHIPIALFLLADKGHQTEKSKPSPADKNKAAMTEFGADLLNSFALTARLQAIEIFLKLVAWIPQDPAEDFGHLPIDIKSHSKDQLAALKLECLGIVARFFGSSSLQNGVSRAFATGDVALMTADFFSPIVEKLLQLSQTNQKGTICQFLLTLDESKSVHAALEKVFAVLPLQAVAKLVETFLDTNRDTKVTSSMISIASNRIARGGTSDVTLKPALRLLLSLLNDLVKSGDDVEAAAVAFDCIGKLCRVHGKSELSMFEATLPAIVGHGVNSDNAVIREKGVNCLLQMLYLLEWKILTIVPS